MPGFSFDVSVFANMPGLRIWGRSRRAQQQSNAFCRVRPLAYESPQSVSESSVLIASATRATRPKKRER